MKDLKESLFDKDLTKKELSLNKLIRALKTIYNDNLTVGFETKDNRYQGRYISKYVINPESLGVGPGNGYDAEKLVKYCQKISDFKITNDVQGDSTNGFKPYTEISTGEYWIKIIWGGALRIHGYRPLQSIDISKSFYDDCSFKKDQSYITQRALNRWQGNAW